MHRVHTLSFLNANATSTWDLQAGALSEEDEEDFEEEDAEYATGEFV